MCGPILFDARLDSPRQLGGGDELPRDTAEERAPPLLEERPPGRVEPVLLRAAEPAEALPVCDRTVPDRTPGRCGPPYPGLLPGPLYDLLVVENRDLEPWELEEPYPGLLPNPPKYLREVGRSVQDLWVWVGPYPGLDPRPPPVARGVGRTDLVVSLRLRSR